MTTRTITIANPSAIERVGIPHPVWRGDPPELVSDGPYYPGVEYTVDETLADDLIAAGYFAYTDDA